MHRPPLVPSAVFLIVVASMVATGHASGAELLTYAGGEGPGSGKHIVLVSAEEEYRTEEAFPMFARVLSERLGFDTTVLFGINRETGLIDPDQIDNIPGLETLADADLVIMGLRWRALPDEQMKHIIDYTMSGRPIISVRTNTHPFNYPDDYDGRYAQWDWESGPTGGGWGRAVTGETWVSHYGKHGEQGARALPFYGKEKHPLMTRVKGIWSPWDVYGLKLDVETVEPILMGVVLTGLSPNDPPAMDKAVVPVAWLKNYEGETGNTTRVLATTFGAGEDWTQEGFRRFIANGVFHLLDMPIPKGRVNLYPVEPYFPRPSGFGGHGEVDPLSHAAK